MILKSTRKERDGTNRTELNTQQNEEGQFKQLQIN